MYNACDFKKLLRHSRVQRPHHIDTTFIKLPEPVEKFLQNPEGVEMLLSSGPLKLGFGAFSATVNAGIW